MGLVNHMWSALLLSPTMAPPAYFLYICLSAIPFSIYFALTNVNKALSPVQTCHNWVEKSIGPLLTKFRVDRVAFGQF